MTPEQQQMIERLEAIEKRKANAAFGSKMWLKSDDDAQIEEDLPTLLTLIREQQGENERLKRERDSARKMLYKTFNALRDQLEDMEEEVKDYD